jgi:hypothetical protein
LQTVANDVDLVAAIEDPNREVPLQGHTRSFSGYASHFLGFNLANCFLQRCPLGRDLCVAYRSTALSHVSDEAGARTVIELAPRLRGVRIEGGHDARQKSVIVGHGDFVVEELADFEARWFDEMIAVRGRFRPARCKPPQLVRP